MQPPEYLNEQPPPADARAGAPRPPIPVIVRLELPGGEEQWWPGEALTWNAEVVLVRRQSRPGDGTSLRFAWVPAEDVARLLRRAPQAPPRPPPAPPRPPPEEATGSRSGH